MDSGVGGSALSCDGVYESDDDNAYFDKSLGLNLVYTWDKRRARRGPLRQLRQDRLPRVCLPGDPGQSVRRHRQRSGRHHDEMRDGGAGTLVDGQDAIRPYVNAHYNMAQVRDSSTASWRRGRRTAPAGGGRGTRTGLGRRAERLRARTAFPAPATRARVTAYPTRRRAQFRQDRPVRVGPDRPDRIQDEPDQGGHREPRS